MKLQGKLLLKCRELPPQPQLHKHSPPENKHKLQKHEHLQNHNLDNNSSEEDILISAQKQKLQPDKVNSDREEDGETSVVNNNQSYQLIIVIMLRKLQTTTTS